MAPRASRAGSSRPVVRGRCDQPRAARADSRRVLRTSRASVESERVAPTQDALYADIDLDLSWSESELLERERTKHVHRLHPYLGKFIPQVVEALLERYLPRGGRVLDPFAGSGTTLVQALESGLSATGADIAAFNCLLMRVKTARYNEFVLERELRDACHRLSEADMFEGQSLGHGYLGQWYAPTAAAELLFWRSLLDEYEHADA